MARQWEGDARNQGAKVRGWEKNRTILQREKQLFKVGETLNWLMLSSSSGSSVLSSFFPDLQGMSLSARKTDGQKPATYYALILLQYALHHLHRIHTIQNVRFEGTPAGRGAEGQELPFSTSGRRLGIDADTKRPLGTCITKRIMFYGFLWI